MKTSVLLICSNIFMTFAWYGHHHACRANKTSNAAMKSTVLLNVAHTVALSPDFRDFGLAT
jgi:uncharacterized protein (DUF486 family)